MGKKVRTRTQYSLINIFVGFVGYFLNTLAGFVCRVVFVKTLSAEYLGIRGLFSDIFTMLSLAELGIGTAICYALYKPLAENDEERISALMNFYGKVYRIIGCVVALIGVVLMPFLNLIIKEQPDINESIYLLFGISIFNTVLSYFFSYRSTILIAAQKNYLVIGINYIVTIVQSAIQIAVLLLTHDYLAYLAVQTLGTLIYNVTISYIAKREYPFIKNNRKAGLSEDDKKSLEKNIKALMVSKISEVFVHGIDNVIITSFKGLVSTGVASNYSVLSGMINTFTTQIFSSLTASVGNFNAVENNKRKRDFFYILSMANFWVFGWGAIGFFCVSEDVIGLFYGEKYIMSSWIPFMLALDFYLVSMMGAVTTYRTTMGLFYYGRYITVFTAILNIIFSLLFGKLWGVTGVFLATAVARVLTNVWYMPYTVFKYGLKESSVGYAVVYLKYIIIELIAGSICWFACSLFTFNYFVNVVIKIIVVSFVVNVTFWMFLRKKKEYVYLEDKLKQIVGREK